MKFPPIIPLNDPDEFGPEYARECKGMKMPDGSPAPDGWYIAADNLTKPDVVMLVLLADHEMAVFDTKHDCELVIKMRTQDRCIRAIRNCIEEAASRHDS